MKPFGRLSNAMVVTFSGATSIHPPRSFHPSMNDVVNPTSFIVSCDQGLSRVPFGLALPTYSRVLHVTPSQSVSMEHTCTSPLFQRGTGAGLSPFCVHPA